MPGLCQVKPFGDQKDDADQTKMKYASKLSKRYSNFKAEDITLATTAHQMFHWKKKLKKATYYCFNPRLALQSVHGARRQSYPLLPVTRLWLSANWVLVPQFRIDCQVSNYATDLQACPMESRAKDVRWVWGNASPNAEKLILFGSPKLPNQIDYTNGGRDNI